MGSKSSAMTAIGTVCASVSTAGGSRRLRRSCQLADTGSVDSTLARLFDGGHHRGNR
jgi:hypothetical protein